MCIDFTNLNKACPQDPFPLPRIDQIVDSTTECDLLCFLDAFSVGFQVPAKPLRFELWGAHEDLLLPIHAHSLTAILS